MGMGILHVLFFASLLFLTTETFAINESFTPTDESFVSSNGTFRTTDETFKPIDESSVPSNETFKLTDEFFKPTDASFKATTKVDIVEQILRIATPADYESDDPPNDVSVSATIAIFSIPAVKFSRTEIEVEYFILAFWNDNRFVFDGNVFESAKKRPFIKLSEAHKKNIWIPKLFFPECKNCKDGFATGDESRPMWFVPAAEAFVIAYRNTMLFNCQYDLTFYPFDSHECHVGLEAAVVNTTLKLDDAFEDFFGIPRDHFIKSGMPAEFKFNSISVDHVCSLRTFAPGENPEHCLQYSILFHRIPSFYFMLVYTPTFVIVVISWATFWLSTEAAAPRVALGLTSLLTLTTQFATAQKDLPPVAYVKALDVWMLMCVVMVFGTLVEFTLAHNIKIAGPPPVVPPRKEPTFYAARYKGKKVKLLMDLWKCSSLQPPPPPPKKPNPLDLACRIIFPLIFAVFNLIYWPYYGRGG